MITKLKYTFLGLALFCAINSCTYSEDTDKSTYSGYVAFDYSYETIKEYVVLLKYIHQFNEYYSQPTASERDSVDRLYFGNIKITREGDADIWTLRNIGYHNSPHHIMTIHTNGQTLGSPDVIWTLTRTNPQIEGNGTNEVTFTIKNKGEEGYQISQHDNYNADFKYVSEWNARFTEDGSECYVTGSGTMVSIQTPQLKLEYTITEPLEILLPENHCQEIRQGALRIFATDVPRGLREETVVEVAPPDDIHITYQKGADYWYYPLMWWD